MKTFKMEEPWLVVDILKPTEEEENIYYIKNNELKSSDSASNSSPRVFKQATIKQTFDEVKYPLESTWMMGESNGVTINFFGDKLVMIQTKDLYARIG